MQQTDTKHAADLPLLRQYNRRLFMSVQYALAFFRGLPSATLCAEWSLNAFRVDMNPRHRNGSTQGVRPRFNTLFCQLLADPTLIPI